MNECPLGESGACASEAKFQKVEKFLFNQSHLFITEFLGWSKVKNYFFHDEINFIAKFEPLALCDPVISTNIHFKIDKRRHSRQSQTFTPQKRNFL